MKITFLGTAAANAYPEAFCQCDNCRQARRLGGPSLRKRSAALINDDLLIDLGPDIMAAAQTHNISLTGVRYCLQTHAHADHLDPSHLLSRSPGYGVIGAPRLHFYASLETLQFAAQLLDRDCAPHSLFDPEISEQLNLQLHQVEAGQTFRAGRYRVTAFSANHDHPLNCLLYAIEADGRAIFYGTDTGTMPEDTWQAMHRCGLRFDVVILDHTYGPTQPGCPAPEHLSAGQVIAYAARMRAEGLMTTQARVLGTHIAHEGNPPHPQLANFAAGHGYEIAYDGLTVSE